jgi:hypothetical protein
MMMLLYMPGQIPESIILDKQVKLVSKALIGKVVLGSATSHYDTSKALCEVDADKQRTGTA